MYQVSKPPEVLIVRREAPEVMEVEAPLPGVCLPWAAYIMPWNRHVARLFRDQQIPVHIQIDATLGSEARGRAQVPQGPVRRLLQWR